MGGLLNLFNSSQGGMARKIYADKQQVDGLEAPRNSLELPAETSLSYHAIDDASYTCQLKDKWSEKYHFPCKRSMKKLIEEETYAQPNKHRVPGIVARLMGIDAMPSVAESVAQKHEHWKKEWAGHSNDRHRCEKESNRCQTRTNLKSAKFKPRKHPQEEELQKFKKDFVAWQAARLRDRSRVLEAESIPTVKAVNHGNHLVRSGSSKNSGSWNQCYKKGLTTEQTSHSFSAPSRIVILKPSPDGIGCFEDACARSSGVSEEGGGIEDFLEAVKRRVKYSGIETSFDGKPSDPKQIAQHIAKQVRESVGRDLVRSKSSRSYRNENQFVDSSSTDLTSRDTTRLLPDSLKQETNAIDAGRSSTLSVQETGHIMKTGADDDELPLPEFSPRYLSRSLSAPVSGTSFRKLLQEDRHILTGAHIQRKQEASESALVRMKKQKRERLNFREKVSGFRNAFAARRGRIFGRRVQSMSEAVGNEHGFMFDLLSGPTVLSNSYNRHENFTEVPPSPASVCSDTREDVCGLADPLDPLPALDLSVGEDHSLPKAFREISSSLTELRRQLNELDSDGSEAAAREELLEETVTPELEGQAKAYTRDLLIASGLYHQSHDLNSGSIPISDDVFEQVEQSFRGSGKGGDGDEPVDRRLLLDLVNESLSRILRPTTSLSVFRRNVFCAPVLPGPFGRGLLDCVWEAMSGYLYPPPPSPDQSDYLGGLVVGDVGWVRWFGSINDEVDGFGGEVEWLIIGDLIEEIAGEMGLG